MVQKSIALTSLLIVCLFHPMLARPRVAADLPDLKIKQYEFVSTNASVSCCLELAIRKVNGAAVTRTAYEIIPALRPGKEESVTLSATGILPGAIRLKDTTFRLIADETSVVAESNEDNNETWHNPN